jgi:hypothetical protein
MHARARAHTHTHTHTHTMTRSMATSYEYFVHSGYESTLEMTPTFTVLLPQIYLHLSFISFRMLLCGFGQIVPDVSKGRSDVILKVKRPHLSEIPPSEPQILHRFISFLNNFFFWPDSPQWARASSFTRFLDHDRIRPNNARYHPVTQLDAQSLKVQTA